MDLLRQVVTLVNEDYVVRARILVSLTDVSAEAHGVLDGSAVNVDLLGTDPLTE